jgi:hypothetical protein
MSLAVIWFHSPGLRPADTKPCPQTASDLRERLGYRFSGVLGEGNKIEMFSAICNKIISRGTRYARDAR